MKKIHSMNLVAPRKRFFFLGLLLLPLLLRGQTELFPGDLLPVGVVTNSTPCTGGTGGEDIISFFSTKRLTTGTTIDITDNGWERANPGQWGNSEGFIRLTLTGPDILPGILIQLRLPAQIADPYEVLTQPGDWNITILSTAPTPLNLAAGGDQLYFLQGGNWNEGTVGNHDAEYTGGRVLYGINTTDAWTAADDPGASALHPEVDPCFYVQSPNGVQQFLAYTGDDTPAQPLEWISRIRDFTNNWGPFANCQDALDAVLNFYPEVPAAIGAFCTVCTGCAPLNEQVEFLLPPVGGPYQATFSTGDTTYTFDNLSDGDTRPITIDSSLALRLVTVTGANGCPYSDPGVQIDYQLTDPPPFDSLLIDTCLIFPAVYDLTSLNQQLYGTNPDTVVQWFLDPAATQPVPQPDQFGPSGDDRVYALVSPSCGNPPVPVRIIARRQPVVNSRDFSQCVIPGDPVVVDLAPQIQQISPGLNGYLTFYEPGMVGMDTVPLPLTFSGNSFTYEVIATSNEGCTAGPGLVTVQAIDAPDPNDFSLAIGPVEGCGPLEVDLSLQSSTPDLYLIDYTVNGVPVNGQQIVVPASISQTLTDSTEFVLLRVSASNGCSADFSALLDTVRVNVLPGVDLQPDLVLQACEGSLIDLFSGVRPGAGSDSTAVISFHSALPPLPGNELPSPIVEVTGDTVYYVLGESALGCTDTLPLPVSFDPDALQLSLATADVFNGFAISCAGGDNGSISASVFGGNPPLTYTWSNGGSGSTQNGLSAGTYSLQVADANGCVQEDSIEVRAPDSLRAVFDIPPQSCGSGGGTDIALSSLSGGVGPYSYSLTGTVYSAIGGTPFLIEALPAGEQTIFIRDANGCVQTYSVDVPTPVTGLTLDLPGRQTIFPGEAALLDPQLNFAPAQVQWTPAEGLSDPNALQVTASPALTTTYTLTVVSAEGCVLTREVIVEVVQARNVFLPSAFSPNDDGANDFYFPLTESNNQILNFQVFDRWGGMMYQRRNVQPDAPANVGWDGNFRGRPMPQGVYVYLLEIRYPDGNTEVRSGEFTLIR